MLTLSPQNANVCKVEVVAFLMAGGRLAEELIAMCGACSRTGCEIVSSARGERCGFDTSSGVSNQYPSPAVFTQLRKFRTFWYAHKFETAESARIEVRPETSQL
jgi:hypothetical protein